MKSQIPLRILLYSMIALAFSSSVGAASNGLQEIHDVEICVVDHPTIGDGFGTNLEETFMHSFSSDIALPSGYVGKVVYRRVGWERSFIMDTPGRHIRGMTGEIRPGDSITATILYKDSVVKKEMFIVFVNNDGKMDVKIVPHI